MYNYLSDRRKSRIQQVLKSYCDDANSRDDNNKYKKLNKVLENVVDTTRKL